jgi:hypothetical protein
MRIWGRTSVLWDYAARGLEEIAVEQNVELARKGLSLVRDIAERVASAGDGGLVAFAIQKVSPIFAERAGIRERIVDVAYDLGDLSAVYDDLLFVEGASEDICWAQRTSQKRTKVDARPGDQDGIEGRCASTPSITD